MYKHILDHHRRPRLNIHASKSLIVLNNLAKINTHNIFSLDEDVQKKK